jgi:hypothetical protein
MQPQPSSTAATIIAVLTAIGGVLSTAYQFAALSKQDAKTDALVLSVLNANQAEIVSLRGRIDSLQEELNRVHEKASVAHDVCHKTDEVVSGKKAPTVVITPARIAAAFGFADAGVDAGSHVTEALTDGGTPPEYASATGQDAGERDGDGLATENAEFEVTGVVVRYAQPDLPQQPDFLQMRQEAAKGNVWQGGRFVPISDSLKQPPTP